MESVADLTAEATYTSPNGRLRAYYRTAMTAEDDFKRRFLESGFATEGGGVALNGEVLARFCLDRFCKRVELLNEDGTVNATHPYTADLMATLTSPYAEGGWGLELSLRIYKDVLKRNVDSVEALKKTSPEPSEPNSSVEASAPKNSGLPSTST